MDNTSTPPPQPLDADKQALTALVDLRDELLDLNTQLEYLRLLLRLQQPRAA